MKKRKDKGFFVKHEKAFVILAALICIVTAVSSVAVLQRGLETANQNQMVGGADVFGSQIEMNVEMPAE
jgi:cell division protein FtsL